MVNEEQRAWAEVDMDALRYNYKNVRAKVSDGAKIMAVVKANGYGHGAVEVAKELLICGADSLAVATSEEGKQLRKAGIKAPILILGYTNPEFAEDLVKYDMMPVVYSYNMAQRFSETAVKSGKDIKIHIKLDTGMSRIGFLCYDENTDETVNTINDIYNLDNIKIEGIFTHLSCADEDAKEYTEAQFLRFMNVCNMLEQRGIKIPLRHVSNSAAAVLYPDMHLDMVRAGIILYGLHPSDRTREHIDLKPVMSIKSRISHIKELEAGIGVSYGKEYVTENRCRVATVQIGYADGYSRMFAKKAHIIHNEKKLNILGRICMDQCIIDVTNVNNINVNDVVIVMGGSGDATVSADDLAGYMGTINYEIVCTAGIRLPRMYISGGKCVKTVNYLE